MGASDKVAATCDGEYTPDIGQLRDMWVDSKLDHLPRAEAFALVPTVQAEFDNWLSRTLPEAKAGALREAAEYAVDWVGVVGDGRLVDLKTKTEYDDTAEWLRARAEQYEEEQ